MTHADTRLKARDVSVSFGKTAILRQLSVDIPTGKLSVIVGPNACGKSTLLRTLARLHRPDSGQIILDGKAIAKQPGRKVAQTLAILPQSPTAPDGISVRDLVMRGRTPHQSALRQWSPTDAHAVSRALDLTGMTPNADRPIEALSGGQRQRAWIAMALAQDTDILLLDEPTTYLDLPHQIELLSLVRKLNEETGRTVAMVLHDINLAARFADWIIGLRGGDIHLQGEPKDVISERFMQDVFNLPCSVIADPLHGTPHVIPA